MQSSRIQPPVPRNDEAPVKIVDCKLEERVRELLAALARKVGQQREYRVADDFSAILPTRTNVERGWETATDVDVFQWLCWLDSYDNGTTLAHVVAFSRKGLDDSAQCSSGGRCRKRYALASLDKGKGSKLKWAMV